MEPQEQALTIWNRVQGLVKDCLTFAEIKDVAGSVGIPIHRLIHLQQRSLPQKGASKSQLLDSVLELILEVPSENVVGKVVGIVDACAKRRPLKNDELEAALVASGYRRVPYEDSETKVGPLPNDLHELLRHGRETPTLEFKETFAGGLGQAKDVDALKEASWIALTALLNAAGGDLLIGVDKHGIVAGLDGDLARAKTMDALIRKVEDGLGGRIRPNPIGLVAIEPVEIDGKTILRVRVTGDRTKTYTYGGEVYVRRIGRSAPALTPTEVADWRPRRERGEA